MTWNLVTATATFPARRNHRVVVWLRVLPPPFVRESQEVVAVATETRRVPGTARDAAVADDFAGEGGDGGCVGVFGGGGCAGGDGADGRGFGW